MEEKIKQHIYPYNLKSITKQKQKDQVTVTNKILLLGFSLAYPILWW